MVELNCQGCLYIQGYEKNDKEEMGGKSKQPFNCADYFVHKSKANKSQYLLNILFFSWESGREVHESMSEVTGAVARSIAQNVNY